MWEDDMLPLTFSERFMLLALNQQTGLFNKNLFSVLGFYLAAAGLMELLLFDSIQFLYGIIRLNEPIWNPSLQALLLVLSDKKREDSIIPENPEDMHRLSVC
jgi:hypothetical protein